MRKDFDIVGSFDKQRVTSINPERTINMFEYIDPQGKRPKSLIPTSGLDDTGLSVGSETGGSRASFVFNGEAYQVFGETVYKIIENAGALLPTPIGTLSNTEGYVGIDGNTFQVIIVDGEAGWIYDPLVSTDIVRITDTSFPANPIDVCYLDGFFVVAHGTTNQFQLSKYNQGMVWGAGTATFTADYTTDILTLSTSNANFRTGVPVVLSTNDGTLTFTADNTTDLLTLTEGTTNFQTGSELSFETATGATTFTADAGTDILTLNVSNENFQTGSELRFTSSGTLPAPLVVGTVYYSIMIGASTLNPGTIKVAASYADAIAGTPINITTGGTGTHTVISNSLLPVPLEVGTTYYSILIDATTIKVATSYANAIAGTPIDITTNGSSIITVNSTGKLPAPLEIATTYYSIAVSAVTDPPPGTIKLATSYANAVAGTAIDLTDNGSSNNTITVDGQLQLGQITSHPGTIVACRTLHRRLFLFSQNFTEVWENAGLGSNLPFRRNNSLLMELGTPAIGSVAVDFDRMFFLAQDRGGLAGIVEVKGTQTAPVSNRALDFQLAEYAATTGVSDARGLLIKDKGLMFYRINFTTSNHTFVYNISMSSPETPRWHEEEVLNGDRHLGQTHIYLNGKNYYGAYNAAKLYEVNSNETTNDGEAIKRTRIGRQYSPEGYNRLRIDRFQLDLLQGQLYVDEDGDLNLLTETSLDILTEAGLSLLLQEGQDIVITGQPVVYLSISKDGGYSYGYSLPAYMGKVGQRTFRTVWRKLGTTPRGQGYTPKIEFFAEVPFVILGAAWDFEVLPE